MTSIVLVFAMINFTKEMFELKDQGQKYFTVIWNYFQLTESSLNLIIIIGVAFEVMDVTTVTTLASITVMSIWFNFLYWARMIPTFLIYVELIRQTIRDILPFLVLFLIIIFLFGNTFYIIDL